MKVLVPGSFDPITVGHLDIVRRAHALFGEVLVAIGNNSTKDYMFTFEERVGLVHGATADLAGITVEAMDGLLVDFCREREIAAIVKGLRAVSDFDYELQMAQMNYQLSGVDTVFVSTNPLYSYLSSSLIKEVATYGGDVSNLLPGVVYDRLRDRVANTG